MPSFFRVYTAVLDFGYGIEAFTPGTDDLYDLCDLFPQFMI